MNSPVRLGVSPAASSTPTGIFNQRFEVLFPQTGTLGFAVYLTLLLFLSVYLHTIMGLPSLQATTLPGLPATALLRVLTALAAHLRPSYWSG